ncbi:MAG TPA: DUF2884 family protein [Gammaproteobacteria bacterium]|nr:DUF2884 family protein [Gammaproteobacteria bacterium]
MNRYLLTLFAGTVALCLGVPVVMASNTDPQAADKDSHRIIINDAHGIHIKDGDVIIDNDAGGEARITTSGTLFIDGKAVPVTDQQKVNLLEYANSVKDMETQAIRLGMDAAGFAMGVVGDVIADLLSGEDEDDINKHANARAKEFKKRALPICKDVRSLQLLQNELTANIPAFKPFAVIEDKDSRDCEHEINSDD